MASQSFSNPGARDSGVAATIKSKVPMPAGKIPSIELASSQGQNGQTPGASVKGFSGTGVKPGKIKI